MAEKVDLAVELLNMFKVVSKAFKENQLTAEQISELTASVKLLHDTLQKENKDRVVLVQTLQEAQEQIVANTSAFFTNEFEKLLNEVSQTVENLKNLINKRLNDIPDTQNFYQVYKYEKLVGGKLI